MCDAARRMHDQPGRPRGYDGARGNRGVRRQPTLGRGGNHGSGARR